jgi:SAM-dependent methyltransferase
MHAVMMSDVPRSFDADTYWSSRLGENWNLSGVGHQEYSDAYNRWLFRRKHAVLRRALRGHRLDRAVDLGSGTGWVVAELRAAGATHVDGCELTAVAVDRLRKAFPETVFHQLDIGTAAIPVETGSVDVVTMLDVAYHVVDDAHLHHTATEIGRMLRPGGIAVITDTLDESSESGGEHVKFRSMAQWQSLLADSGLRLQRTYPYFRTLSLPRDATWRHWWHPRIRGPVEWAMDTVLPLRPWLRLAVLERPRR